MKFKKGDMAWVCDSASGWIQVEIVKMIDDCYIIRRPDKSNAFGVDGHRLLTNAELEQLKGYGKKKKPGRVY